MVTPGVSHLFVDTNILVFATDARSSFASAAETELEQWRKQGTELYISVQVLREYLAVTTRPVTAQTAPPDYTAILGNMATFRSEFHVLEDTRLVSEKLCELVQRFAVKGRQVHDASIAATMLIHGLQHLLTHNGSDFTRFSPLIIVHPL
jgi:predicted nucleic acid-binding protein